MKLSKREKVLLIVVFIIMGAVAYFLLYLQPTLNEMNKLSSQNMNNQTTINANIVLKATLERTTLDIDADEAKIEEFSSNVRSAFDQPDIQVYLYNVMNKYGYKVMITFNGYGDLGHVKYCNISVSMKGSYDALKSVLNEFANSEHFIKVTQLVVDNAPSPGEVETSSGETDGSFADNLTTAQPDETANLLNIGMVLEIYNIGNEIPPDKTYPFTDGAAQYGGDIFNQP